MPAWRGLSWFAGDDPPVSLCLTFVEGTDAPAALRAFGADVDRSQDTDEPLPDGTTMVAALPAATADGGAATVLVETAGPLGVAEPALRAVSRRGSAASVSWDADDLVMAGLSRRGRPAFVGEVGGPASLWPRHLRALARRAEAGEDDLREAGIALAEHHTGVGLDLAADAGEPPVWHPVVAPRLGLRATPEELVGLEMPTARLVRDAQAAAEPARRRVVEWACTTAVTTAGLDQEPGVAAVLARFGRGAAAVATSRDLATLRVRAARRAFEAEAGTFDTLNSSAERSARVASVRTAASASQQSWALEAVAYAGSRDSVAAVLGSTYCTSIALGGTSPAARAFLAEASVRLRT